MGARASEGRERERDMLQKTSLFAAVVIALTASACGDSDGETTASSSTTDQATGTDGATTGASATTGATGGATMASTTAGPMTSGTSSSSGDPSAGDTAANGEDCAVNLDCASRVCEKFTTTEVGVCVDPPEGGATRIMGTVRNLIDGAPFPSAELRVLAALDALSDPTAATPLFTGTADGAGVYDFTSPTPIDAPIGTIALLVEDGHYPTATGIARPVGGNSYGPAGDVFDLWVLPDATLTDWNGYLQGDDALAEFVPLGEKGGVVGVVRDSSGDPMAGAVVESTIGDGSVALIRYLAEDGMSFTSDMTSSNGLFILVAPQLAEEFTVAGTDAVGTAGSAATGAVFVMALNVP